MKQLVTVTGPVLDLFRKLLPSQFSMTHQAVVGCLEDQLPCGCAVVDLCGKHPCLSWLYVAEPARRRGVGSALLDAVCQTYLQGPDTSLQLTYAPDSRWAPVFQLMTARRGGLARLHSFSRFRIPGEDLAQLPLVKGAVPHQAGIVPLRELNPYQLRELRSRCDREGIFSVSRADFSQADPERSMVYLSQGQVLGLTALRSMDGVGQLSLDLLYLDKRCVAQGLFLLRQTLLAILAHPEQPKSLQFLCVNDASRALARKLLGEAYEHREQLTTVRLTRNTYPQANQ